MSEIEATEFLDNEEFGIPVHCFNKNKRTKICIHVQEFKGTTFLSIREFYLDRKTDEWMPSRKGVTIPPDLYIELVQGVADAGEILGVEF